MPTTINVTRKDIADGVRSDCQKCPISKAINRVLNSGFKAEVFLFETEFYDANENKIDAVLNPDPAREFIVRFDNKDKLKPFSFEMEIPSEYLK